MKKMLLLLSTLSFSIANAQDPLPIWMTEEEKATMSTYEFSASSPNRSGITTPPQGNLRNMAEWEEVEYLLLTWVPSFSNTLTNIVAAAVNESKVLIIANNPSSVENTLTSNGIALDSVEFIQRGHNTIWIRDYAANSVYQNWNDDLILVDWIYNRPRPLDNSSPEAVADELNIPLYQMTEAPTDIIGTGGNWMSDGFGTGFSSMLIVDENEPGNSFGVTGKSLEDIENIFEDFMGIERYVVMENLPYDAIDHIDMHMKLLDEETILVSEYPPGVADGPQIEANIQYVLDNYMSVFGTPYKTVKIPAPPSVSGLYPDNNGLYRTYTNSVFVNNSVLVPFYREEYDTIAQRIYEEALPGYNIVGINVDGQNGEQLIAWGGAIHCITHSVGVRAPMIISHQPLADTYDNDNPYEVEAYISHRSGIANATLYYRVGNSGPYQSVAMTNTSGEDWVGNIPAQNGTVKIQYYVEGEANSGKVQVRPMPAPDGYWEFIVFDSDLANLQDASIEQKMVYPNPASAITVVPVVGAANEIGRIELIDITGKVIDVIHDGAFELGQKNYYFNAADFAKGAYRVKITSNRRSESHQVVIL
jgi:agmatine deiminase